MSQRLLVLAREIYADREDLQATFKSFQSPEFWYWLMWHGQMEYPQVATLVDATPPQELRDRVAGGGVSAQEFYRGGLVDWRRLEQSLRVGGYDFSRRGSVLDLGCGCGRTLRFFGVYDTTTAFHGADIDEEALAWCRRHIDFAVFTHLTRDLPTPFGAATFDAVMSYSLFTHLSEDQQLKWIAELGRIMRPGAVLVVSTHGRTALRLILDGYRDNLLLPKEQLMAMTGSLQAHGVGFVPYAQPPIVPESGDSPIFDPFGLPMYGTAFNLESYVRANWTQPFEIVQYLDAPDDWQDIVILRRR